MKRLKTGRWLMLHLTLVEKGISQTELATHLGCSHSAIWNMMRFMSEPNYKRLIMLSEYLDVPIEKLVRSYVEDREKWQSR